MAELVKIVSVHLYCGYASEQSVINTFKCKKYLDENAVPYAHMFHLDNEAAEVATLSEQVFGLDYQPRSFKEFPLVMWQQVYDNYDVIQFVAESVEELQTSSLLANKHLIG